MKREHIKVEGHIGRWYVIDESYHRGQKVYLLEHETYGDEAACVIIDQEGKLIMEDVWNGLVELDWLYE